jgi:membrane protein implicated in regulation of membrane protease activity
MRSNKALVLWTVNVVSFTAITILAGSGLLLWLALPHGGHAAPGLPGMVRQAVMGIHRWAGVLFTVVIAIHIGMHWPYVVSRLRKTAPPR